MYSIQSVLIAAHFDTGVVVGASGLGTQIKDQHFLDRVVHDLSKTILSGVCVDEHAQDQVSDCGCE